MAKLYFYYSSMNAGKTTSMLQSSYNYRERGMETLVLAPEIDDRHGVGRVISRIGLRDDRATTFSHAMRISWQTGQKSTRQGRSKLHCVLVDEAQFLTRAQVFELGEVADRLNIPGARLWIENRFSGRTVRRQPVPARLGG